MPSARLLVVKLPIDNTVFAVVEFVANTALLAESAWVATLALKAVLAEFAVIAVVASFTLRATQRLVPSTFAVNI